MGMFYHVVVHYEIISKNRYPNSCSVLRGSSNSPALSPVQNQSSGRTLGGKPIETQSEQTEETAQIVYQDEYSDDTYDRSGQENQNLLSGQQYDDQELTDYGDGSYPLPPVILDSEEQERPVYSSSSFVVRVRIPSGSVLNIVELKSSSTLSDLCEILEQRTAIKVANQQCKFLFICFDLI